MPFLPYFMITFSLLKCKQRQGFDNVTIETVKVSDHVSMRLRAAGNIGVSIGSNGVFYYR